MKMRNKSRRSLFDTLESRRLMATFTVNSVLDGGMGTLRWAVDQANATPAADVVQFNIGLGGAYSLALQSPLTITQPLTIDATTQPNYAGVPLIRIADGNNAVTGIVVNAANSVVRGLAINGFGNPSIVGDGTGIYVNAPNVTIEKNYIGIRSNGVADGNEGDGINISALGTHTAIRDNVISSNGGDGVEVHADYSTFNNNIIGLDSNGSSARGNAQHGIRVQVGYDAFVGGGSGGGNVISANGQAGLYVAPTASSVRVFNSSFGLSKSGNAMFANGTYGIDINGVDGNLIGNENAGNRFGGDGIRITGNSEGNNIRHNVFGFGVNPGFDVGGTLGINVDGGHANINDNTLGRLDTALRYSGNLGIIQFNHVGITKTGVAIPNQLGITIGGNYNDVQFNSVSNNSLYGVWVTGGTDNILRNSAWNNGQSVWVSNGANGDLPVPDVHSITSNPDGSLTANVGATVTTAGKYRFMFYSSDGPGHATSGDTQRWIRSVDVQMHGGGQGFDTTFTSNLFDGQYLTVQLVEIKQNGGNGNSGEPGPSKKAVGVPAVYSNTFQYETGHAWSLKFSSDVSASLNASDLDIRNPFNVTYPATSVTWDAATKTARFVRSPALPDAAYTVSLKAGSVSNANGSNIGTFPITFRVIRGDANNDDNVNFDDLLIVAQNYGKTGRTWSTGDFNYDGVCNFDDLLFLAQRYVSSAVSDTLITNATSKRKDRAIAVLD